MFFNAIMPSEMLDRKSKALMQLGIGIETEAFDVNADRMDIAFKLYV